MKKQKIITLAVVYGLLVIGNIIPVLVNFEDAQITIYSIPAIFLMSVSVLHGTLSYFLRHKGNYLMLGRKNLELFAEEKDYTYSEKYLKRFFDMLELYCAAIPFYIPLIFLTETNIQTLWALVVFAFPQIVFVLQGIGDTMKEAKEAEIRRTLLEEERKEQERREEQGYWK